MSPGRSGSPVDPDSFGAQINKACQSAHTKLNRLITSRLPLAIPPNAPTSDPYATGLLHFSHIFFSFETAFRDLLPAVDDGSRSRVHQTKLKELLEDPWVNVPTYSDILAAKSPQPESPTDDVPAARPTQLSPEVLQALAQVLPPGLHRTPAFQHDLAYLLKVQPIDLSVTLATYPSPSVLAVSQRIRRIGAERPHVLLAYAWSFYLAIFSGGRWIRAQLVGAGPQFWGVETAEGDDKTRTMEKNGLGLWYFPGDQDGEDIRAEFKRRFEAVGKLLTEEQRAEVIEEAVTIFDGCEDMVRDLDAQLGSSDEKAAEARRVLKRGAPADPHSEVAWNSWEGRLGRGAVGIAVLGGALGFYVLRRAEFL